MKYPKIIDFQHFVETCDDIKAAYGGINSPKFNLQYVQGWRNYIYSRTNINKKARGVIWEYLNSDIDKVYLAYYFRVYYKSKGKNCKIEKVADI